MRLARKTDASVAITLVNASDTFGARVRNHQVAAGQPVRGTGLLGRKGFVYCMQYTHP
jgi:hypothetical protein